LEKSTAAAIRRGRLRGWRGGITAGPCRSNGTETGTPRRRSTRP
jgi:hypothetical protein